MTAIAFGLLAIVLLGASLLRARQIQARMNRDDAQDYAAEEGGRVR